MAVVEADAVLADQQRPEAENSAEEDVESEEGAKGCVEFHAGLHGKNILLGDGDKSAERISSYNQAVVISRRPLLPGQLFRVRICRINDRWTASLTVGVVSLPVGKWSLPIAALDIRRPSWLVHADSVYHSGAKVRVHGGPNLNVLDAGHTVGILLDSDASIHLYVDDVECGIVARDVSLTRCHAVVDLYGRCERVVIMSEGDVFSSPGMITSHAVEHREKADKDDGKKEKELVRVPMVDHITVITPTSCEYQRMCSRFRSVLGLPDGYFNLEAVCCYCDVCHKLRGDAACYRRGDPPRDYAVPIGWCRFALRFPSRPDVQHSAAFDKWHVAYHGTKPSTLRRLLDTGDLLAVSGNSLVGGTVSRSLLDQFDEKNKPEEEQVTSEPIVLSPSIKYAGLNKFAPKLEFRDPKTKKLQRAHVAIQLYIKPGSYKVGTAQASDELALDDDDVAVMAQIDAKFSNNELEWSTKERGSTALCALLVRID
jgi:neuralized-like protein 4